MKFQSPRGTEDVLPSDAYRWQFVESTFRDTATLYGYREIRTPTFEETSLFIRGVGETTDIVTKEMYEFKDKGERSMTLKPEGTAGAIRAVIQHSLCSPGNMLRLYYITPFFRYERPQKGRLREPHQAGFELVGVASPYADAEVIEATANFYKKLGFGSVTVSLNSIGRAECRNRYRAVVLEKAAAFLVDQSPEFRQRVEKNPLRLLDSKDEAAKQVIRDLPPITDFLEDAGRAHFEELQRILTDHGIPYRLDPSIVRGLDYYTDTVFELVSASLGAQDSLCGGGRYDNLCQELGGKPMPSVGVGIGIERALIAMAALGLNPDEPRPQFFAIVASPEARSALEKIAGKLREKGRAVLFDLEDRSMKSQIKLADKARARFALILGADEIAKGVLLLRDLDASTQSELNLETALETLERLESP